MASGKSVYLEKILLDIVFGATPWTPPATLYFALSLNLYNPLGSPTEPVGNNYSRASSANNTTEWPAASGAPTAKSNANVVAFPNPSASWGIIQSLYVMDAASAGNVLYGGDLVVPATVLSGQAPSFSEGDLKFMEQ